MDVVNEPQGNRQAQASRRYQAGVAKRLDRIISEIESLRVAVTSVIADHQRNDDEDMQQDERQ